MPDFFPSILAWVADPITTDGFLVQPPIGWYVPAEDVDSSAADTLTGRYHKEKKEAQGVGAFKRQDTYIEGTGSRTGRSFDIVSGTAKDDWEVPQYDVYGILFPDSTADETFEAVSHATTDTIESCEILLWRGFPPTSSDSAHSVSGNYAYLHLAYQSTNRRDVRFAFEYGQPIRLDYSDDGGSSWKEGFTCWSLGNLEHYLTTHQNLIKITVKPDAEHGVINAEIGDGFHLRYKPTGVTLQSGQTWADVLPQPGNIRLLGKNGWAAFAYFPARHGSVTLTKAKKDFGRTLVNLGNAQVRANTGIDSPSDQSIVGSVETNDNRSIGFSVTATREDAGDGEGSADAPRLSDGYLIIPEYFPDGDEARIVLGLPPADGAVPLSAMRVEEVSVLDDLRRTITTSCLVTNNNWLYQYTGAYARRSLLIQAANDQQADGEGTFVPRFWGVAGVEPGLHTYSHDPTRLFTVYCQDGSERMNEPLGEEMCFDGWCIFSAVRFLAIAGNVHPKFLVTIPEWPYGPADASCPYPILPRGTGLQPKYRFLPHAIIWEILQLLTQDTGALADILLDPRAATLTEISIPYYMGWNMQDIPIYGCPQFRFEPYDPAQLIPKAYYTDWDETGAARIEDFHLLVDNSQMRTELNFQSLDPTTFELLQYHRPQPPEVLDAVGRRRAWLERSARYGDREGLVNLTEVAAQQASIPTITVQFRAPFQPSIFAGDGIYVGHFALGGVGAFNITELRSVYGLASTTGEGYQESYSVITARALINSPHT